MQVIATARGHDGLKVREVGEEFAMPDGSKGSWFQSLEPGVAPADTKVKPAKPAKAKPAATMSEASAQFEDEIA